MADTNKLKAGYKNAEQYFNGCTNYRVYYSEDFPRAKIAEMANLDKYMQVFRDHSSRKLFSNVADLIYAKKSSSVLYENIIRENGVSAVIAKATVAFRVGDTVSVRAGLGSSTCSMTQMSRTITVPGRRRMLCDNRPKEYTKTVPRGFFPHELADVQDSLQYFASNELYEELKRATGLSSEDNVLTSIFINEARKLRQWFREIVYEHSDKDDVPFNNIGTAIYLSSFNTMHDTWVGKRLMEVISANKKCSFFICPHPEYIFVVLVNKEGEDYSVHVSSFRTPLDRRMPVGAFAWSVGAWNIERPGEGSSPTTHELVHIFPPL